MAIDDAAWAKVAAGDTVVTSRHEKVGRVVAVATDGVTVKDPAEGRRLAIPRAAFASRRGRRLLLASHPLHSAGEGPERYARSENLADEWVAEQTQSGGAITVESDEDRFHAHREGTEPEDDVGDALDNVPTEVE